MAIKEMGFGVLIIRFSKINIIRNITIYLAPL